MKKILLVLIVNFFIVSCTKANDASNTKESKSKKEKSISAPDFTLKDLEGNKHTLSDYKGKVVLLDFWATYCRACRAKIPYLMKFNEKYKDSGLVIFGMGFEKEKTLKAFDKFAEVNYPILLGDRRIVIKYGVQAIPTTFIMDKEGELVDTIIGFSPGLEKKIESVFLKLLREEE